jgi:phosphoglycerate dehydrogenase-like enzyme
MMTEYVVMHVLRLHRDMPAYQKAQANREWLRHRSPGPSKGASDFSASE